MIRSLVVDDEEPARARLSSLLRLHPEIEIVGEAEDGTEAIQKVVSLAPDLVFLDIQMPVCSGIEVAASLPSGKPSIIVCTAYEQYAIDAFELHAVDYLLKPISRTRLAKALERVLSQTEASRTSFEDVVYKQAPLRFLGKRRGIYQVIPKDDVLYFDTDGGLTRLQTTDQYYWMEPSLNDLERRLENSGYCRVSRQALVNLDFVEQVVPMVGGHGQVRLTNGSILDVSRRRMKELLKRLQEG